MARALPPNPDASAAEVRFRFSSNPSEHPWFRKRLPTRER
jgi:hypothetical protein